MTRDVTAKTKKLAEFFELTEASSWFGAAK